MKQQMTPRKFIRDIIHKFIRSGIIHAIIDVVFILGTVWLADYSGLDGMMRWFPLVLTGTGCIAFTIISLVRIKDRVEAELTSKLIEENYELAKALIEEQVMVKSNVMTILRQAEQVWKDQEASKE